MVKMIELPYTLNALEPYYSKRNIRYTLQCFIQRICR